jgi:ribosomal protein L20A (L18A)
MAEKKIFLVEGEITEKGGKKRFSKKVRAQSASFAVEKALCLMGSKNKIKRNRILVRETKEVKEDGGRQKGN